MKIYCQPTPHCDQRLEATAMHKFSFFFYNTFLLILYTYLNLHFISYFMYMYTICIYNKKIIKTFKNPRTSRGFVHSEFCQK